MNSNRKIKSERTTRTPVHLNTSEYVFKNSATKKFSPNLSRRPNLNETVGLRRGPSDIKFKTKLASNYEVSNETEFDMVYNDYLQALMKKQFAKQKINQYMEILEDQLLIQNENVRKRQQNLKEIVTDTKSFQTKSEIIQIIDCLQKNYINFAQICAENSLKVELNHCRGILNLECDKIVLKGIKPLESHEEYEKLAYVLQLCDIATQKIVNSGRNFNGVYNLAENMRNFSVLTSAVHKSQQIVSEFERNAVYSFLQHMSDFFARKCEDLC